jgi:hypothetical protein
MYHSVVFKGNGHEQREFQVIYVHLLVEFSIKYALLI